MQQFGRPFLENSQSNNQVVPYLEYPGDMAFAVIDRIAKDMVRGGILIESASKELRDALSIRLRDLNFEQACYKYLLNFFYGSCAMMTFVTSSENPKIYEEGSRLQKVNVASFLPNVNNSFVANINSQSLWDLGHGEPYIRLGGDMFFNSPVCELLVEWKPSLYSMIKPHADAIEEMTKGVKAAAQRLGVLIGNKKMSDNPQEQEVIVGDAGRLRDLDHNNVVVVDVDEKITNMAMNLSGLKEAAEKCYYDLSIVASMPQNVLLGKGQGVGASAVEDFRLYANRIKYEQELKLRPLYKKLFNILVRENDGIMREFEPEDVEFEFAPIQSETEKEKADTLKSNLENILVLIRELGIPVEAAAAVDDKVSDLLNQQSKNHTNKDKDKKNKDKDNGQNNAGPGESLEGREPGSTSGTKENL